ncbi:MAG: methyltransferase [Pseudomonadota bacterium]
MGIYDAWLDFRDKCLTSPEFHRFALKFPLTRPIVRKRQSEVFDVVSGFVYSQILVACVELDVFSCPQLRKRGATLDALAQHIGLGVDETKRLAKGAAALRLLEERNNRFRLGDLGAALSINEGALAMIRHHKALYQDLQDPVSLLQSGRQETNLSRYWDYARNTHPKSAQQEAVAPYSALMSASQQMVSEEVIAAIDFMDYRKLMDVGGGQGTFLSNIGEAYQHLDLVLFDLPEVVDLARDKTKESSAHYRMEFCGGSFFDDDLPKGADVITLVRIIHDHDDEAVRKILTAAYNALESDKTLLICEPMSTGKHAHRISDAYFNFYLYAMGSGRPRTPEEVRIMLKNAGFSSVKRIPTRSPFVTSIISAQK